MMRALRAFTLEIDEVEVAVKELLDQLRLEENLLKNAVGILTCHKEFVFSGVVKAVCEALPFNVVGTTSTSQGVNEGHGILAMTLMVLTSDEVEFHTAETQSLAEQLKVPIEAAYGAVAGAAQAAPALLLSFAPLLLQHPGDLYVELLDRASGGLPIFGSLSMDNGDSYDDCYTIYNGSCTRDTMALLLLCGPVRPRFFVAVLSEANILSRPAIITCSEGNLLKEINGMRCRDFLATLGLVKDGVIDSDLQLLVAVIDCRDGTPPVGKVLIRLDEDGFGVCGGYMPEGKELKIAYLVNTDVLKTTGELMESCREAFAGRDAMLVFSCNTRTIALGGDVYAELELIQKLVGGGIPYLVSASGGEICPYAVPGGRMVNRFQNNSIVVCVF